jgi:drug/metabolite transporter, DME family
VAIKAVAEPALKVACYRSAIAALVLILVFRPRVWRGTPSFLTAIVSYAGCLTTFVVATKWTSAANAIFLQYSGVVWVLLFSPLVLKEPLRARDAAAVALALAGMGLFFVGELDGRGRAGDLVAALSGVLFAALVLSLRRERELGAEAAVTYGNVLTALVLLPLVGMHLAVSARSAAILAFLGIVQIAGAYVLFVHGIKAVPATQASLVGMLEPVANPIWVLLLLGEQPRSSSIVGGLVVLGAIAWRALASGGTPTPAMAPPD